MLLNKLYWICLLLAMTASMLQSFAATFTITNVNDAGAGSFRQAIIDANTNTGTDVINFSISGVGPYIIALASPLPDISDLGGVLIDGYSQAGSSVNTVDIFSISVATPLNSQPMIVLRGNDNMNGVIVTGNNTTIQGIIFQNFGINSVTTTWDIELNGRGNMVKGCWFEIQADGADYVRLLSNGVSDNKCYYGVHIGGIDNKIGDGTPSGINWISGPSQIGGAGIWFKGGGWSNHPG